MARKLTPMPPDQAPSGLRAERSRAAIVAAARTGFLEQGFDVSLDAVAAAAGVSKVTIYNHFRNKEALFTAVVGDALDAALNDTLAEVHSTLATTGNLRDALISTARVWVAGVTAPPVLALRNLVTGELRRFPELGQTWQERGPGRFHPVLAELLTALSDKGELDVPDIDVAVLHLFALTLYPHLVYNTLGASLDPQLGDRLIDTGIDMFLDHYQTKT